MRARSADGGGRRPPARRAVLIAYVLLVVVFAVALIVYQFAHGPLSWGSEGDLGLTISIGSGTMPLEGSITCDYVLTNTGDSDIRILPPYYPSLALFDSNGTPVEWVGPVAEPPPPDTNKDLVTLRAGESWSMEVVISGSRWDLRANETYRVVGSYRSRDGERVTLPYWSGQLSSNETHFSVEG